MAIAGPIISWILMVPNSGRNKQCILPHQYVWGTRLNWFIHSRWYKITGLQDIFSVFGTLHLLYLLRKHKPDIIHFNIINDKCLNIPLLVRYINKHHIAVVWTMHDCRAFKLFSLEKRMRKLPPMRNLDRQYPPSMAATSTMAHSFRKSNYRYPFTMASLVC